MRMFAGSIVVIRIRQHTHTSAYAYVSIRIRQHTHTAGGIAGIEEAEVRLLRLYKGAMKAL
jgi:hypothetical protein